MYNILCYINIYKKMYKVLFPLQKISELEKEMLNGQKLQGPFTAEEVNYMLKAKNMENRFPLFTTVHRICIGETMPMELIEHLRNHPEYM